MIFGSSNPGVVKSFELFNVKTHQSCIFGTLPYGVSNPVGGVLNGFPVFCGGVQSNLTVHLSNCYKYQESWLPVIINLCTSDKEIEI